MIASEYDDLDRELGRMDGDRPSGAGTGLRVLPILVGVVSLLALGGIVWYAYSQGVREGSEDAAPLLRPESSAKVAPDDPGGREIAGTNLEVYDRINGESDTPAPVEMLLPPPEEARLPPPVPAPTPAPAATSRTPVPAPALPEPSLAAPAAPPPTFGGVDSTSTTVPPQTPAPQPSAPQPSAPQAAVSQPQAVAAAPPAPAAIAAPATSPASAAGNGWRIQLAALRSDASARAEWAKLQAAHADLLGSLALEVQQATVKGVDYFRVRGGPLSNGDAAKALCAGLKAKNIACLPVAPGK